MHDYMGVVLFPRRPLENADKKPALQYVRIRPSVHFKDTSNILTRVIRIVVVSGSLTSEHPVLFAGELIRPKTQLP
jgi:hypothetical protein